MLRDGALYNFAIVTQGQNGVIAQTANQTVLVNPDLNSPSMRIDQVTLTPVGSPPTITWVATVRVVDSTGAPVVGASVRGEYHHFIGAGPALKVSVGPATTGVGGLVNFTHTFTGQASGDKSRFTVPQLVNTGGTTFGLPVTPGTGIFLWPESDPTQAETFIP